MLVHNNMILDVHNMMLDDAMLYVSVYKNSSVAQWLLKLSSACDLQ